MRFITGESHDGAVGSAVDSPTTVVLFSRCAMVDIGEVMKLLAWERDGRARRVVVVRTPGTAVLAHLLNGARASSVMYGGNQRGALERWVQPAANVQVVERAVPMRRWISLETEAWLSGFTIAHD